jgi:hypothetical protein
VDASTFQRVLEDGILEKTVAEHLFFVGEIVVVVATAEVVMSRGDG